MARLKMVNGELVKMTADEEAAFLAAAPPEPEADTPRSKEDILADLDALRAEVETHTDFAQLTDLANG